MPRKFVRKTPKGYTAHDLQDAASSFLGGSSLNSAASDFNVPRSTLWRFLANPEVKFEKTVFTSGQEKALVERTIDLSKRGFPLTIATFLELAYKFGAKLAKRSFKSFQPFLSF